MNLRSIDLKFAAAVRSGVAVSLMEAAAAEDTELRESLPRGRFGVVVSGPGRVRRTLHFASGSIREGGRGGISALLRFPSSLAMARAFSGGKGTPLPLPAGPGFLKALKGFLTASKRVGALMSLEGAELAERKALVTSLYLSAALRGVAEVANGDHWTRVKSAGMPEGLIRVSVTGEGNGGSLEGWIRKREGTVVSGRGSLDEAANAELVFDCVDTAFDLLTGRIIALAALGDGRVSVRGKIPMIRALFPLLDRFSEIMGMEF